MTDLHSALQRYLNMRKGFGFKYQHQTPWSARTSAPLAGVDGAGHIGTGGVLQWLPPID